MAAKKTTVEIRTDVDFTPRHVNILLRLTECYVRECFSILGDHHDEDTVMRVVGKIATEMAVEIAKRQLVIEMTEACFTPEEREKLKQEGLY